MFKVDLHTHSVASPDGGISKSQYQQLLEKGILDAVAITDHNTAEFALELRQELGDKIIVGEEIMSSHGEIIGLYLTKTVPGGLSPLETVQHIKDQGGVVYIPHPFETIRKGIGAQALDEIVEHIDIMEVCNGRAFVQNRGSQTVVWAKLNNIVGAASSDAHGVKGVGKTFSSLPELPTRENLVALLERSVLRTGTPNARALLYPKYHRLRKKLRKA